MTSSGRSRNVPVNAYETFGAFVILAPFPAVTESNVSVELTEGTVRIWADLRSVGPREYVIHEWEYGGCERSIELPTGFGSRIEAVLTNGQLVVRVLRDEGTVPQLIHPNSN